MGAMSEMNSENGLMPILFKGACLRTWRRHWDTSNALPLLQRVKLSFLLVARAVVNGVEATVNSLKNINSNS